MANVSLSIRTEEDFNLDFENDIAWNAIADKVFEVAGKEEFTKQEVVLSFCDEEEIQYLNKTFRNKDIVTDVLSFNTPQLDINLEGFDDEEEGFFEQSLGDIVICVQKAQEQAKEIGQSLKQELVFLFVHGLLHLLGYDHELSKEDEKLMFGLQDQIIMKINAPI